MPVMLAGSMPKVMNFASKARRFVNYENSVYPVRTTSKCLCRYLGCSCLYLDERAIAKGLRVFEGLPHRLKFVREVKV